MRKEILIVEDQSFERELYRRILNAEGYTVFEASTTKEAAEILRSTSIAVCILDIRLPDSNGIQFVAELKDQYQHTEIIVLVENNKLDDGIKAIRKGAFDCLVKNGAAEKLGKIVSQALIQASRRQLQDYVPDTKKGFDRIISKTATINTSKRIGLKAAATSANVLLVGETGAVRDAFAEAIHYNSKRSNSSFVSINCKCMKQQELEKKLFGCQTGTFSGASKNKKGLLEEAHDGTIFLEEIGAMTLDLQTKILHVLDDKGFIKLGDTETTFINSRFVAATSTNLLNAVKQGKFREDLYQRISSFVIQVPSMC